MIISLPDDNVYERQYIIDTIFTNFLGIEYQIVFENRKDYEITMQNGNKFIVKDAFFSKYTKPKEYLTEEAIPERIKRFNTDFQKDIIVLYGENKIDIHKNKITLFADIFASTFFMLTRWEEYVNKNRDNHNRFPATESVAFRNNFLNRPVVNEYVELIWQILLYLGFKGKRKKREFQMILTHDVDLPRLWWNQKDFIKSLGGALLKRKSLSEFFHLLQFKLKGQDPFDTFDKLMSLSESAGLKSHFFFMSGGTSNKDNYYQINHPVIVNLIKTIKKRGHKIGFHPSYNAYNDEKQFKKEKRKLEEVSGQKISFGRHHFLRFAVPQTWQIWENNQMEWDSTMSYHDQAGFRCGVCYDFPVFNIITRKKLKLIERPLTVMEGSFITYQNKTNENVKAEIQDLINNIKKFNGNFVFLWHNSSFNLGRAKYFESVYKEIINKNTN